MEQTILPLSHSFIIVLFIPIDVNSITLFALLSLLHSPLISWESMGQKAEWNQTWMVKVRRELRDWAFLGQCPHLKWCDSAMISENMRISILLWKCPNRQKNRGEKVIVFANHWLNEYHSFIYQIWRNKNLKTNNNLLF